MESNVKHLFILNPQAFWNKWKQDKVLANIHAFFSSSGNYEIFESRFPRDAVNFIPLYAKDLSKDITLRVYAIGGDGILFDCLNGLIGVKNAELGVIPYGLTNNFVRGFGKNAKDLFRNIEKQSKAASVPFDVIRCGNNYSLNYCIVGVEAEAIRHAEQSRKKPKRTNSLYKWLFKKFYNLFYYIGALVAHLRKKVLKHQYEMIIDGEIFKGPCLGVSVFNAAYYGNNLHPAKKAMPNDGILDIIIVRGHIMLRTFGIIFSYIKGRYYKFPKIFKKKEGVKIKICSLNPIIYSMDNISFFDNELDIELMPDAVRFIDATGYGYKGVCND